MIYRHALLPGSYDPMTVGHLDVIKRASEAYERVFAALLVNPEKKDLFSTENRIRIAEMSCAELENVEVVYSDGYTADLARELGCSLIVKGICNEKDLEYERVQAEYNFSHGGYETELYECSKDLESVSSTLARERIISGTELSDILPQAVIEFIKNAKMI